MKHRNIIPCINLYVESASNPIYLYIMYLCIILIDSHITVLWAPKKIETGLKIRKAHEKYILLFKLINQKSDKKSEAPLKI